MVASQLQIRKFRSAVMAVDPAVTVLSDLPLDVLPRIAICLDLRDVLGVRTTCRKLRLACDDDLRVWRALCRKDYGHSTGIDNWRSLSNASDLMPYRAIYKLLHHLAPLVGLWVGTDRSPVDEVLGTLFHIRWASGCLQIFQVKGHTANPQPQFKPFVALGPAHPDNTATMSMVNGQRCCRITVVNRVRGTLTDHWSLTLSTQEAYGGPPLNIAQGPPEGRSTPCPVPHNFISVPLSSPTPQQPHAGVWKAVYGPHGLEVLRVAYIHSSSSAAGGPAWIQATKLLGDRNIPAGQVAWWVEAAPLQQSFEAWEGQELQAMGAGGVVPVDDNAEQQQQQQLQPGGMGALAAAEPAQPVLEPAQLQQLQQPEGQQPVGQKLEGRGLGGAYWAPRLIAAPPPQWQPPIGPPPRAVGELVAVHRGQVQLAGAGYRSPEWVEGRLWLYSSGEAEIVWSNHATPVVRLMTRLVLPQSD